MLQKARITTSFGLPKELHGDADVTKNKPKCNKRPDDTTLPNKGPEDGSCSPSYSGTLADEDEACQAPRSELQSNIRGKPIVNLFGGLLGLDVCKRKRSRPEERTVSKGRDAQDHYRPSKKDGNPSVFPSCSEDGWPQSCTIESTQEGSDSAADTHQVLTVPLVDTQALMVGVTTSRRQALLSFDNKGRLVVESSSWQQQSTGTSGTQGTGEGQGDGLGTQGDGLNIQGTQRTVSTKHQEVMVEEDEVMVEEDEVMVEEDEVMVEEDEVMVEEDEVMVEVEADLYRGQKRKRKSRIGEEDNTVMDLHSKEPRRVSKENLAIIKEDQQVSEGGEQVTLMRGRGQKKGMVGSQRKRARKGVVDVGRGEDSVEEGMKVSIRSGDEANCMIVDEVEIGNRKVKMKRNIHRDKNVLGVEDVGELKQYCASNKNNQTLSKLRSPKEDQDQDVLDDGGSRLMLSKKNRHSNRGVWQLANSGNTEHQEKVRLLGEVVEEGTHDGGVADKVKRKRNTEMTQPVDLQVEDGIGKMGVKDEHRTDKSEISQRKHLNEGDDVLLQGNPLCCKRSVHGGSVKNKSHYHGNKAIGHHHGNMTPDKARRVEVMSSDEEWGGACTAPEKEEGLASETTPLCGSWADIFKKPLSLKDDVPLRGVGTGVGTPLTAARIGAFKMQTTPIDLREEKSYVDHPSSAASSPALTPCWIRSPYLQESPSNFSPSPLHPPLCGKYVVTTTMDHSPFSSVGHVQQRSPDEPFWHLELPHLVPMLSHLEPPHSVSILSCCPNSAPTVPRAYTLSQTVIPLRNPVPPSLKVCDASEQERLLSEMERSNPTSSMRALFARYTTLTHTIGGNKASVEVLSTRMSKETSTKKRSHDEFVVAIKVLCTKKGKALPRRIVVDRSAYGVSHKKSLRLSKSRHKRGGESDAEHFVENAKSLLLTSCGPAPPPSRSELHSSSDLWSERYQPVKASEVLGNTAQVQELYQWMTRWKDRATAQRRDSLVAGGNMTSTGPPCSKPAAGRVHSDSDEDFVVPPSRRSHTSRRATSSDSEQENMAEGLCPVALLCGPHGSGKTAAVLACAQELGFKVFIIDSTTLRSRQNILSVLREATLSHQVTKQLSTEQRSAQPVAIAKETKPSRTAANNLLSFFKPQKATISSVSPAGRTKGKCRHKDGGYGRGSQVTCSSKDKPPSVPDTKLPPPQSSEVALVVATVIILEEVDILFEDEKGFWSAIYEIIASTKRPIVMTSNADLCVDCDHLTITFCPPSPDELANHIEALCLAHGTMVPHEEAKQLAIYLDCDTRKVLNTLQYWLSALPHEVSVARAKNGGEEGVASVSVEQLLGLSYQQASLLKHTLCPSRSRVMSNGVTSSHNAASVLSEALLKVHGGQLGVNVCLKCDAQCSSSSNQPNTSYARLALGNRVKSHSHPISGVAKCPSHFMSFPWRVQQKPFKCLLHPSDPLELMSDFLNIMSDVDVLDPWGAPGGVAPPWWVTESGDVCWSRVTHSEQSVSSDITATMEGLVLAAVAGVSHDCQSTSCCHDYYGLLRFPESERHCKAVHTGQMLCCEVFDAQTEMSRRTLVVDCLPALHLLCQSESIRETASTQRRFRHYLQSSTVDIEHLKSFAKTAALCSTPEDRATYTHSIP